MKTIRYAFEAALLYVLYGFFKIFPAKTASSIGGLIGRTIGPHLAASRKAYRNIEKALPQTTESERKNIIAGMWDNLGRVIAEFAHIDKIASQFTEIEDKEYLNTLLAEENTLIFISAHLANWELNTASLYTQLNTKCIITYREPNNPWVARFLKKIRTFNGKLPAYPKSPESARMIMKALKENNNPMGMLIDQKHNQGIQANFFGMPAMTNIAHIKLAQKFKASMVFTTIERTKGPHFKIHLSPKIKLFNPDGAPRDVEEIITETHDILEKSILKNPEQWLWIHRRWKNH